MRNQVLGILCIFIIIYSPVIAQNSTGIKIKSIPRVLNWENQPLDYSINDNTLRITAGAKTDMFRDPNVTYNTDNAPKLLFKPEENFVLSCSIEHAFTSKWDGGAILLKQDSLNWIKFCFEKDYIGKKRVVSVVTKNISDDCNSVSVTSNKVFYKMAKAGNVITLYYSTNGKKWFLVRHLQFDTPTGFQVGFMAQSPTGSRCQAKFEQITYRAKRISNPYTGE